MKLLAQPTKVLDVEKISLDELEYMIKHSAPYTHEWANRRWMHWIFNVDMSNQVLKRMAYRYVRGAQGVGVMYEDCDLCYGQGCKSCGWHGEIRRRVS